MTGLPFALAPFVVACLVARRDPRHRPVRDALGASASFAACSFIESTMTHRSPRMMLFLWSTVALTSGWAYLRAFRWDPFTALSLLAFVGLLFVGGCLVPHGSTWQIATWGPFVASSVVGALAVWAWWAARLRNERKVGAYLGRGFDEDGAPISVHDLKLPTSASITERCALILLASDVCMLAFIPWGGVQMWQGRAAAVAVALVQLFLLWPDRFRLKRHQ